MEPEQRQNRNDAFKEALLFARRFVTEPRQIGSVVPSSRFLVNRLLSLVDWSRMNHVVELGAGTGVFTREIVKRMAGRGSFVVFEIDPTLRQRLDEELHIHCCSNAEELPCLVPPDSVDLIVSSLPWTVLPKDVTSRILNGMTIALKPDGHFLAYQYSKQMKRNFEDLFQQVKLHFEWRNMPPAFIYHGHKLKNS